jgi:phosphoglycerate dehydrogenase-like enzyme
MKPDSYFINLGRGKTVVEDDLIQILKDKVIAGAGLDVFDVEPLPKESELWNLDNVLMTPHIANIDKNYWKNQIELFIDNLQRFKNNKKLKNLMNLERGY